MQPLPFRYGHVGLHICSHPLIFRQEAPSLTNNVFWALNRQSNSSVTNPRLSVYRLVG
jgi:hypothetical protein